MPKNANTTELAMERQFLKTAWKIFGWDLCIVASLFKEKKKKGHHFGFKEVILLPFGQVVLAMHTRNI